MTPTLPARMHRACRAVNTKTVASATLAEALVASETRMRLLQLQIYRTRLAQRRGTVAERRPSALDSAEELQHALVGVLKVRPASSLGLITRKYQTRLGLATPRDGA